eukprot:TRINITY_DN17352_c0_g1_i4.p1 TRINITY_DN17352_c0_g1~~TRINITY_DN17352_c0_g1_i4.p1  ORF type:complete len:650 (+),score=72.36 TRINITY_DN17352_c0_g1_i4:103-2052(+)
MRSSSRRGSVFRRVTTLSREARWYITPPKDTFDENWSPWRQWVWNLINNDLFNTVIGVIIFTNLVFMALQANDMAQRHVGRTGTISPSMHTLIDQVFLVLYTFEIFLRILASNCSFFSRKFQLFDLSIVVFAWIEFVLGIGGTQLPSANVLRIFRVFRLTRAVRVMVKFPELHNMVKGFASAVAAMFWGFVMILLLLVVFAILTVELLSGKNELFGFDDGTWCSEAFQSVWLITLMFFQNLVAGDSWGQCSLPVIKKMPATFLIFAIALVCVQLGFTNLILSTIVETATSNRQEDAQVQAMKKRKQGLEALDRLSEICANLDADQGGDITLEEFLTGYDNQDGIRDLLQKLELERKDIMQLFLLMDEDSSGTISQEEFIECIRKAESQDMRVQMLALKLQVSGIARAVEEHMSTLVNLMSKQSLLSVKKRRGTTRRGSMTIKNHTGGRNSTASGRLRKMQSFDVENTVTRFRKIQLQDSEKSSQSCVGAFIEGRDGGGDLAHEAIDDRSVLVDAGIPPEQTKSTSYADSFTTNEPSVLNAKHMGAANMLTPPSLWSMKVSSAEKGRLLLNGDTAEPENMVEGNSLLRKDRINSAVDHFYEDRSQKIYDAWPDQPPAPARMEMQVDGSSLEGLCCMAGSADGSCKDGTAA